MKLRRRHVFLYVVIISFLSLFVVSQSFDKYARNSSITQRNKYLIETRLSEDDKKLLIDENIQVELFLPFIKEKGFTLKNYEYYNLIARYNRNIDKAEVVKKGNALVAEEFTLNSLQEIFKNKVYTIDQLIELSTLKSPFFPNSKAEFYPNRPFSLSNFNFFITNYKPRDLEIINSKYVANEKKILIRKQANKQLNLLCDNLTLITNKKCGGLQVDFAYLDYDYAQKNIARLPEYIRPGHSDFQLGNSISFVNSEKFNENDLYLWLLANAHKFGYVQRYPVDKVKLTRVSNQYGIFRYVGLKEAKTIYENKSSIEEMHNKD